MLDNGTEIGLVSKDGLFRVSWCNLDEGICGSYNENDPEDVNLLRFDCYVREDGEWADPGNASYCTRVPADTPNDLLEVGLQVILDRFAENYDRGYKRVLEELSWVSRKDLEEWRQHVQ